MDSDTKGKNTSMDSSARKKIRPIIIMLKDCCGLEKHSKHVLGGQTKSGLHWQVEGGRQFVEKDKQGVHWEWVTECEVPVGDKSSTAEKRKPHKRKERPEDDALKELADDLQL